MGDVGHQISLGLIEGFQLAVRLAQPANGALKLLRHFVEGLGEFFDLVSRADRNPLVQISLPDPLHALTQSLHPPRDTAGERYGNPVGEAEADHDDQCRQPQR